MATDVLNVKPVWKHVNSGLLIDKGGKIMIQVTINDKVVCVEKGKSVLEAALSSGIYVPNLCYQPGLRPGAACRLCIVEVEGCKGYPASCTLEAASGMNVFTETKRIQELRRQLLWLIMSEHPGDILANTPLAEAAEHIGLREYPGGQDSTGALKPVMQDDPLYTRDMNRCILCGRCVKMCSQIRGVGAIGFVNRGIDTVVGTFFDRDIKSAACRFCGACAEVCPTGAIRDRTEIKSTDREKCLLPCVNTCPAGVNIPRYIRYISEGRVQDALEVIREKVPIPHTLGLVCNHPCEGECRRQELNSSVSVRALKRFAAERDNERWKQKCKPCQDTGKKIAIVGSGPAGLTAAWFLRLKGHQVTVFEAKSKPGGMLRQGIPVYRLPDKVLDREIGHIVSAGVDIITDTCVDCPDDLLEKGYHAVLIAVGAPEGMDMMIPGEDNPQVIDGITLLSRVNMGLDSGLALKNGGIGTLGVVGGGNVAIDCVRTALRLGSEKVHLLYRRSKEEMPACPEEIKEAELEGIIMNYLVNPVRVISKAEGPLQVECIRMQLGEPDASGRRRPVPIKGSEFILELDYLVKAIGQKTSIAESCRVALDSKGRISVNDDDMSTDQDNIWAAGDVVTGPWTVIEAIAGGRRAASGIDRSLGGDGVIDRQLVPDEEPDPWLGRLEGFAEMSRVEHKTLPVQSRFPGFEQVDLDMCSDEASAEAERCMQCQLRLKIRRSDPQT